MPLREDGFGLLPIIEVTSDAFEHFDCGRHQLNQFLVSHARDFHEARIGFTTVVFHQDLPKQVVGYFTLSNDSLPLTTSEQTAFGLHGDEFSLSAYPAVKLGRLAIALELQGQGIGRQIMDLVHGEILGSHSLSAARLVTVDAHNEPRVLKFYEAQGYEISLWAEKQSGKIPGGKPKHTLVPARTIKMIRDLGC